MMEWIKVDDELPLIEDVYLIWPIDKYAGNVACFWPYESFGDYEKGTFFNESDCGSSTIIHDVTHWCKIIGPVVE